jgi:hypothetical protein
LVQHRYVAYQPFRQDCVIVAGIFHENGAVPPALKSCSG